ncbi:MAG: tetratricopeptide (TPR) repeat protein [Flavobacterium sp.]|jgi:tetratricopeptide (TPR) repeat protein
MKFLIGLTGLSTGQFISVFAGLVFPILAHAQMHDPRAINADPFTASETISPKLSNLGDHHIPVTTSNPRSQFFFDQGYRLTLAFNHSEALRSFKEAVRVDQNNAMAYWGIALVLGPNLNLPMQATVVKPAWEAIQSALALKTGLTKKEADYIDALAVRYSSDPTANRAELNAAYVDAMKKLVANYPNDLDAATLYASALMNQNPWDYWYKDGTPKHDTSHVLEVLQGVIKRDKLAAGAHHYLIHLTEAYRPELAEQSADQLGGLMPAAGHLVHMPSHIYMRVGRYKDSYDANVMAVKADAGYLSSCRAQGIYPLMYYPHNTHFLVWSAMFLGRSDDAMNAAEQVVANIPDFAKPEEWSASETFRSQKMVVLVRFGHWNKMLAYAKPEKSDKFMTGLWHYGRGLAHLNKGNIARANEELSFLEDIRASLKEGKRYQIGFSSADSLLDIAIGILDGEILAKDGDVEAALAQLEKAVRIQDGLMYNEPPSWYFPVRHILGAVLLDSGLASEAEVVYWEDLRRNPNNGYALFGIIKSLDAQNKTLVAKTMSERFDKAWAYADVKLTSSRY